MVVEWVTIPDAARIGTCQFSPRRVYTVWRTRAGWGRVRLFSFLSGQVSPWLVPHLVGGRRVLILVVPRPAPEPAVRGVITFGELSRSPVDETAAAGR